MLQSWLGKTGSDLKNEPMEHFNEKLKITHLVFPLRTLCAIVFLDAYAVFGSAFIFLETIYYVWSEWPVTHLDAPRGNMYLCLPGTCHDLMKPESKLKRLHITALIKVVIAWAIVLLYYYIIHL